MTDIESKIKALEEEIGTADFVAHRTRNISWAHIRRAGGAKLELLHLERLSGKNKGLGQRPFAVAARLEPGLSLAKWAKLVTRAIERGYPVDEEVRLEAANALKQTCPST